MLARFAWFRRVPDPHRDETGLPATPAKFGTQARIEDFATAATACCTCAFAAVGASA
jgi:hypothetical protein